MRKLLLAAALILALPTASQAQFGLGLRIGYGMPGGDVVKDSKYSDFIKSSVPFQLDAMFKTSPSTAAGLYLGYAVNSLGGNLKASCDVPGLTCSSNTFRAGIQFTGEFLDLGLIGLWGGIGTGYEAFNFKVEGGGTKTEVQLRGWEWATISAGADLKPLPVFKAGLFVSYGFGKFNVGSVKSDVVGDSGGSLSPDKTVHNMFQIGLRGMFNL
jgi:hypothetical protein